MYLGDFTTANTVYVYFNTFDSNDPSASVTLTGLALGDIFIYKNGSTTERSSTAGFTLLDTDGIDFDGKTGIHGFSIDLSNNTDSGFYAAGGEYTVVVASVTVDAATVNFVAAQFSIERTGGALALLKGTNSLSDIESKIDTLQTNVGTAGAGLTNIGTIATVTNLTNLPTIPANWITAAGIDTGAIDADALAADAGTEIGTAVWATAARTLTAATNITSTGGTTVPQTGDSFARLGAPAGASVSADIDAISAQIDSIGSGTGAALNFAVSEDNASAPIKTISSVGTQTGTYANTLADDGTTHQIASVGNAIDWVYGFDCGPAKSASKVVLRSNMAATGDTVTVSAYNFSTLGWDVRTTITGTAETLRDVPLLSVHTGTGADKGKVYTRFTFSEADAGTLVIDEAYVQAQQSGSLTGYALGAIWINTAGSNTNTVPYVDGTADNPVSTWAAALTLSAAIGIKRFKMAAGSSITLTADSSEYELLGDGLWSLALGGQDVSNSYFLKASVSGTGAGTNTIFEDCQVNASTSTGPAYFVRSGFNTPSGSPFNAAAAGQYVFNDCISLVAGSGTPYFDFAGTGGATGVNFRRWSGGSNTTLDSNCVMTMEVVTGGGQTVTTGGANVEVRGICRAVSVVLSASETVQVAAVTGPVTISGTAVAATVNLYGVHGAVTNTSTGSTVNALGQIAAILADTNELQTDWANGGRLDLLIDAIKVVTDALPNSGALTDLATAAALATVDGNVDSILLDTAEIGAAGAGLTAVPWNASWDAQVESEVTDALNAYDPPTKAELDSAVSPLATSSALSTVAGYLDTEIAAILADTNELQADWANGGRLDLILDARASQSSVDTIDGIVDSILVDTTEIGAAGAGLTALASAANLATVDSTVDAILVDTDTTIPGLIAALNDLAASDILTTALTESYAADGAAPTLTQALYLIQQFLYERATSGTTVTVKKLDGSTTAATLTLNDGTSPTSITRAS